VLEHWHERRENHRRERPIREQRSRSSSLRNGWMPPRSRPRDAPPAAPRSRGSRP
jgi:hypothetical protein